MTDIHLYNTLSRTKERFEPIDPDNVRMYVCGPTVYDRAHIGNARPVVVFDVLYRLLRHVYGAEHVTYVRNFTDVDDKIIARAQETRAPGETLEAATRRITDETIGWYHEDTGALGALRPDREPRCTEYIPPMVRMIEELLAKGCAYVAEGHVLFDVARFDRYGRLSRRSLDDMVAGARVEVAPYKRNPMDFVLWKPSTPEQPGWDGPVWEGRSVGRGRPGWHIECSAMARELLGEVFDIHAGGIDLQFPHHENELAQSCCAHGLDRMANVWMHNGFLQVEGEKMAKSLGNFFTVKDLLDEYRQEFGIEYFGPAIRYRLLMGHYRSPLDAARPYLEEAATKLDTYRHFLHGWTKPSDPKKCIAAVEASGVIDALSDDLNTPKAIAILDQLVSEIRGQTVPALTSGAPVPTLPGGWADFPSARDKLGSALEFLGFSLHDLANFNANARADELKARILQNREVVSRVESLLQERANARKRRDFIQADSIRESLAAAGVEVKDTAGGSEWWVSPDFDPAKLEALR